jgi:hypothetical protein
MRTLALIAVGICFASAAAAEPEKAPLQKAEQPARQQPIVVAAADSIARPTADARQQQQADDGAKPARRARVTTCRCGDQNPND